MNLSQLDYHWFQVINHFAVTYSFFNPIMAFTANNLDYLFYIGVIIYWFTRTESNRQMVFQGLVTASLALGTNKLIGTLYHRDRPFVHHHVIQLVMHEASASFPSNHAAASFAIAASIWFWRKRDGWIWFILAAAISFSRVWSGIHYPTDVIGGAILGILLALLVNRVFRSFHLFKRISETLIQFYENIEHRIWKPKNRV
ncbi:phosphatase PAP2 family protein [Neobacillus pocheonensis]|uniref:Phosphatase PAP2 family protein n=1 Tax=Neobacillus pocheonensis TaxID=363869 RepID=A0ABT0W8B7_9BACI|nr:phosphatase PAP2 family protein [Neobacillus pocheonensis]